MRQQGFRSLGIIVYADGSQGEIRLEPVTKIAGQLAWLEHNVFVQRLRQPRKLTMAPYETTPLTDTDRFRAYVAKKTSSSWYVA